MSSVNPKRPLKKTKASLEQTLQKLNNAINEGDLYVAHNLYKSIISRFYYQISSPFLHLFTWILIKFRYKLLGMKDEIKKLLVEASIFFFNHNEFNSGADFALMFIDFLKENNEVPNDENIDLIIKIFDNFKVDNPRKISFIRNAVDWSSNKENNDQGHPKLHNTFAMYFNNLGDYETAQKHFIRGSIPEEFAKMLKKWSPETVDIELCESILMYLCLENLKDANILYDTVVSSLSKEELDYPLIRFCSYLLRTLERDALPLFKELRLRYKSHLDSEPKFNEVCKFYILFCSNLI